jgi:hypothetical protein
MTVGDVLDRMSSAELTEWVALFQIEASEEEEARAKNR